MHKIYTHYVNKNSGWITEPTSHGHFTMYRWGCLNTQTTDPPVSTYLSRAKVDTDRDTQTDTDINTHKLKYENHSATTTSTHTHTHTHTHSHQLNTQVHKHPPKTTKTNLKQTKQQNANKQTIKPKVKVFGGQSHESFCSLLLRSLKKNTHKNYKTECETEPDWVSCVQ